LLAEPALFREAAMKLPRRQFLHLGAGAAALPALSRIARAQAWPTRPIRAIVAGGAGSAVDVVPRVVFDQLSKQLGQPIVVENRTGAGGTIAATAVAKADPDGYTILAQSSALTVAPWLHTKLSYDTMRDISGVVALGSLPNVLVTSPLKGSKTIQAFVAAAKAKPGSFNYTSTGVGTATHMSAERFRVSAGIEAVHVPVKSGPEALTEILSGRADFYLCPIGTALPFIRDRKLLGLVVSGARRAPELPEVPTTSEAGFANADYTLWLGLFAPAKTPRDLVNRLHDDTVKAIQTASVQEKLAILGVTPMSMTPEQFDAHIKDEVASNGLLVKAAGIKPE
jgi:tripartite-type tricarboxylate transporter receptor subunit TctC